MKRISVLLIFIMATFIILTTCKKDEEKKIEVPNISTLAVTEVTATTAISGGEITSDGGGEITSKGIVWSTSPNPTFEQHTGITVEGAGTGLFQSTLTGLTQNTTYYLKAYANNSAGAAYGSQAQFTTELDGVSGQPCPGSPTVSDIDGNIYNTVLIGNQCWIKENLKTTKYRDGTSIEYPGSDNEAWYFNTTGAYAWFGNDTSWKDSYGALYNWYAVNYTNGLCPKGWHVPSDDEWAQLIDYLAAQGFPNSNVPNGAGNALKSCRQVNSPLGGDCNSTEHPRWDSHGARHGFDEYGFSGLPSGIRTFSGTFAFIGDFGWWWSSTEIHSVNAWYRYLNNSNDQVTRYNDNKTYGYAVRCLKD
jgi:uncharacterized protein (TIGR02145 family)